MKYFTYVLTVKERYLPNRDDVEQHHLARRSVHVSGRSTLSHPAAGPSSGAVMTSTAWGAAVSWARPG